MDKVTSILKEKPRTDLPDFRTGDHIKVYVSIIEGDKERIQPFEGDVISIRGNGSNKTFTVRKIASGVGVERIFPFNSPKIAKIELLKIKVLIKSKPRKIRVCIVFLSIYRVCLIK